MNERNNPILTFADEWENMTGALDLVMAALIVSEDTCARSTSMPNLFISSIISKPNSDRPSLTGGIGLVAESTKFVSALINLI